MKYSASTNGFYDPAIHSVDKIPTDAVDISNADYVLLMNGQTLGMSIVAGVGGIPTLMSPKITVEKVWEQIKIKRDQRKVGGVKVKVGGVDKWFHSDDASRIQQMGLVMMGANIPANLQWKTLDGSFVTMTQAVAGAVFAAAAASDQAVFAVAEGHRVAMEASADPAAYDYSTGWPKIYGE